MLDLIVLGLVIAAFADLARSVIGSLPFPGGYVRPALIGAIALGMHLIGGWGLVAGLAWLLLLTMTWGAMGLFSVLNALHLVFPSNVPRPPWYGTAFAYASGVLSTILGIVVTLGGLLKVQWYWHGLDALSTALCLSAIATIVLPHMMSAARAKREAQAAAALAEIDEDDVERSA